MQRLYTPLIHAFSTSNNILANMPVKYTCTLWINPIFSTKIWEYHLSKQAHCCQDFWRSSCCRVFYFIFTLLNFHQVSVSLILQCFKFPSLVKPSKRKIFDRVKIYSSLIIYAAKSHISSNILCSSFHIITNHKIKILMQRLYTPLIYAFWTSNKVLPNMHIKHTGTLRINPVLSIKTWGYHLPKHAHFYKVLWSSSYCDEFYFLLLLINFHKVTV